MLLIALFGLGVFTVGILLWCLPVCIGDFGVRVVFGGYCFLVVWFGVGLCWLVVAWLVRCGFGWLIA